MSKDGKGEKKRNHSPFFLQKVMEKQGPPVSIQNQRMKRKVFSTALALLAVSFAWSQDKSVKPPPPPPAPPAVEMKEVPPAPPAPEVLPVDEADSAFLKKNPSVKSLGWRGDKKVLVNLKAGGEEVYDLGKAAEREQFEARYGSLPLQPPPPPVPPAPPKAPKKKAIN